MYDSLQVNADLICRDEIKERRGSRREKEKRREGENRVEEGGEDRDGCYSIILGILKNGIS